MHTYEQGELDGGWEHAGRKIFVEDVDGGWVPLCPFPGCWGRVHDHAYRRLGIPIHSCGRCAGHCKFLPHWPSDTPERVA